MNIYKVVISDGNKNKKTTFEELVKMFNEIPGNAKLDESLEKAIRKYLMEYKLEDGYPSDYINKNLDVYDDIIAFHMDELKSFTKFFVDKALDRTDETRASIDELYRTLKDDIHSKSYIRNMTEVMKWTKGGRLKRILAGDVTSADADIKIPIGFMDKIASSTIRIYGIYVDKTIKDKSGKVVGFERNYPLASSGYDLKRMIESILESNGIKPYNQGSQKINLASEEVGVDQYGNPIVPEKNMASVNVIFSEPRNGMLAPADAKALLDINIVAPIKHDEDTDGKSAVGNAVGEYREIASRAASKIAEYLQEGVKKRLTSAMNDADKNIYAYHIDMSKLSYDSMHGNNIVKEDGFRNEYYVKADNSIKADKYHNDGKDDDPSGMHGSENDPTLADLEPRFVICYDDAQDKAFRDAINKIDMDMQNAVDYYLKSRVTDQTVDDKGSVNDRSGEALKMQLLAEVKLDKLMKSVSTHTNDNAVKQAKESKKTLKPVKIRCYMLPMPEFGGKVMVAKNADDLPTEATLANVVKKYLLSSNREWFVYNSLYKANDGLNKVMASNQTYGVKPFSYEDFGLKSKGYDTTAMDWKDEIISRIVDRLKKGPDPDFDPNSAYENDASGMFDLVPGNATLVEKYGYNQAFVITCNRIESMMDGDTIDYVKLQREIKESIDDAMPENIVSHIQFLSDQGATYGYDEIVVVSFNYHIKENYKGKKDYMQWLNDIKADVMNQLKLVVQFEFHSSDIMTYDKVDGYVTKLISPAYNEKFDRLKKKTYEMYHPKPVEQPKPAEQDAPVVEQPKPEEQPKLKSYRISVAVNDPDGMNGMFIEQFIYDYIDANSGDFVTSNDKWNDTYTIFTIDLTAKTGQSKLDAGKFTADAMRKAICDKAMDEMGDDTGCAEFISKVAVKEVENANNNAQS